MTKKIKGLSSHHIQLKLGYRFLMDFGFVRGPSDEKNRKGNIMNSIDGYTSYLLIQNEISRYTWDSSLKIKNHL